MTHIPHESTIEEVLDLLVGKKVEVVNGDFYIEATLQSNRNCYFLSLNSGLDTAMVEFYKNQVVEIIETSGSYRIELK